MRNARPWPPGTASPTRSPAGVPPRSIPITTWPASTPSTRCRRPSVHRGRLLKLHPRQPRGGRSTDAADYPTELTAYTLSAPEGIKRSAAEHGPAVAEFAQRLFDGPLPWAKVRQGHKLIRMGQRYTPERLDAACRRALDVDLIDVRRVERILVQALERSEAPEHPPPLPAGRFARPGSVFAQAKGGQS